MNEFITCSLEQGDVTLLFQFPRQMLSAYEQKVVEWIVDYTVKFRKPPTVLRLTEEHSLFIPVSSLNPLRDIYERTLIRKRNIYAREFLVKVQSELKAGADPLPHIEELHQVIREGVGDVTKYTTFDRTSYYRRPTSYPYGITQIDKRTGGISQGDLVYTVGRLGTGKTTIALWMVNKWLIEGRKILLVSNENRADDVIVKIDSFIGGFNPIKKRTMAWNEDDLHRLETVSLIASRMEGEMIVPNQPVRNVKELYSLVHAHRPEIVVIDGVYLMSGMSGNSNWEKLTEVSRELKQMADGEGVPLLGIHQANRRAIGKRMEIEDVAYADALAQDADLLLGVNSEEDGTLFVECLKNRWGKSEWGMFLKLTFDPMSVRLMEPPATEDGEEESE